MIQESLFKASLIKVAVRILLYLPFFVMGLFSRSDDPVLGWVIFLSAGFGLCVQIRRLVPSRAYIRIDEMGIKYVSLTGRPYKVTWLEYEQCYIQPTGQGGIFICIRHKGEHPLRKLLRLDAKGRPMKTVFLGDIYNASPSKIINTIEEFVLQRRGRRREPVRWHGAPPKLKLSEKRRLARRAKARK